jgi:hypothetical protein
MLGMIPHSYEAYCLDEAVIFFGLSLESMLEEAGNKPGKEEKKAKSAREALLNKIFSSKEQAKTSGYADPASMFS